jgi:hypothetical protein
MSWEIQEIDVANKNDSSEHDYCQFFQEVLCKLC